MLKTMIKLMMFNYITYFENYKTNSIKKTNFLKMSFYLVKILNFDHTIFFVYKSKF